MERSTAAGVPAAATDTTSEQLSSRLSAKILLAESNLLNQKIAVRNLQAGGHQVTVVTTGRQLLAALPQNNFDLVLMEAEMPELNGYEAIGMIREHEATSGGHIPIVAMTSDAKQGNECLRAGVDHVIAKPLNLSQLHQVVTSCLLSVEATPTFDLTPALANLSGDQAFLNILASMFLEDAPALIADIRTAIKQQDGRRLERSAHKLRGSASPFLASAVTDAAQTLESLGESGQLATAKQECLRLEEAIEPLLTALSVLAPRPDLLQSADFNNLVGPEETTPCTA